MKTHGAFEEACLPLQRELYKIATRICRNPDTAKDLVQDTLLHAMLGWSGFEVGSNVRAWLFRILTNTFINAYRKRRRHERFAEEHASEMRAALYGSDRAHYDLEFSDPQFSDEVESALAHLDAGSLSVVSHADLDGERHQDIADALDVPLGTSMSRLFRAHRALRAELAGFAEREYRIKRAS